MAHVTPQRISGLLMCLTMRTHIAQVPLKEDVHAASHHSTRTKLSVCGPSLSELVVLCLNCLLCVHARLVFQQVHSDHVSRYFSLRWSLMLNCVPTRKLHKHFR